MLDLYDLNTADKQRDEHETQSDRGIDWDTISDSLRDLAHRWVPDLFPNGRNVDSKWRLADITGRPPRNHGSCVIHLSDDHAGEWFDYEWQKGGGPASTVKEACGLSGDALAAFCIELIERHGGAGYLDRPRASRPARSTESEDAKRIRNNREAGITWDQAVPYLGTLAETYLRARGISALPNVADLRFHGNCTHFATLKGVPALLALFRDPNGNPTSGIHRIYLKEDGSWHIGGDKPKMMLGTPGLVFLGAPDANGCIGIAEGIETTLAAMELFNMPGVAAASTGGMREFGDYLRLSWNAAHPLRSLSIWADKGKGGGEAAESLYAAAQAVGLPARIVYPQGADDFADDLKSGLRPPPAETVTAPEPGVIEPARPSMSPDAVRIAVAAIKRTTPAPAITAVVKAIGEVITDQVELNQLVGTIKYKTQIPIKVIPLTIEPQPV